MKNKKVFAGIVGAFILSTSGIVGIEQFDISIVLDNGQTIVFQTNKICKDTRVFLLDRMKDESLTIQQYAVLKAVRKSGCREATTPAEVKNVIAGVDEIISDGMSYIFYDEEAADFAQDEIIKKRFTDGKRITRPETYALGDLIHRKGQEAALKEVKAQMRQPLRDYFDKEDIHVEDYITIDKIVIEAGGLGLSGEITGEQLFEAINKTLQD